jgi:hypothetical protein
MLYPAAFSNAAIQSSLKPNALLYGPAGSGKTDIVLGLAKEARLPIYKVSPSQLQSSFQGRSKRNFAKLVETVSAEKNGCIVFFDEADTLLSSNLAEGKEADTSIVNVFKELVQVGKARSPEKVIWIAVTNFPGRIVDVGVLSRFSLKVFIGLPVSAPGTDGILKAYRTQYLINMLDAINVRRCGDVKEHKIELPKEKGLVQDLETILFFYTPRELDVLAQNCWANVDVTPFKLHLFRYYPLPGGCTNIYKKDADGQWKLVRATEAGAENSGPKSASSTRSKPVQDSVMKESDLKRIDQLDDQHMMNIRWEYVSFEHILKTIRSPGVFPSVTLESLLQFFDYAQNILRDYEGTSQILRLLERGYDTAARITSKEFDKPAYLKALPNWELPHEVTNELYERGLWTHPKKKEASRR